MSHKPYSQVEQEQAGKQTFYRKNNQVRSKPVQILDHPLQAKRDKKTPKDLKGTIHDFFQKQSKSQPSQLEEEVGPRLYLPQAKLGTADGSQGSNPLLDEKLKPR